MKGITSIYTKDDNTFGSWMFATRAKKIKLSMCMVFGEDVQKKKKYTNILFNELMHTI